MWLSSLSHIFPSPQFYCASFLVNLDRGWQPAKTQRCHYCSRQPETHIPQRLQLFRSAECRAHFGSPLNALRSLETVLEKVAILIPTPKSEDKFDGLAHRPKSEDCSTLRIWLIRLVWLVRLKITVCKQIAIISTLLKDAIVRLFDDLAKPQNQVQIFLRY